MATTTPQINARSELIHAFINVVADVAYWTRTDPPQIFPDFDDFIYEVQEQDILDNLASQYYGEPYMRWVIKRINNIRLEPNQLIPGVEIRIPSVVRMRREGVIAR